MHQRGPHGRLVPGVAQVRGHGAAADALQARFVAEHRADARKQPRDDLAVRRGAGRLLELDKIIADAHAVLRLDLLADGLDRRDDLVELVAGHDAAIHVEHVAAGNGVDVLHIGFFLGRLEGGVGRIEKRVLAVEALVQFRNSGDELGGRDKRILAGLGCGGVALLAFHNDLEPEHALLGYLDHGGGGLAEVRHQEEVVRAEELRVLLHHIVQAVLAAGLFIGHQKHAVVHVRGDVQLKQRLGHDERADHALVVVLDAAADEDVALNLERVRVGVPQGPVSRGNDVRVRDDPESFWPCCGRE